MPIGADASLVFSPDLCMWILPEIYPEQQTLLSMSTKVSIPGQAASYQPDRKQLSKGVTLGHYVMALESTGIIAIKNGYKTEQQLSEFLQRVSSDIAQEATVVLEFIEAMSCSNVSSDIVQRKLKSGAAAKRARAGKLPIFEMRALTVTLPGKSQVSGSATVAIGGGRASPRQHLRRGHIRRLDSGKRVWVQAAVVGASNSGVITKKYVVKTESSVNMAKKEKSTSL